MENDSSLDDKRIGMTMDLLEETTVAFSDLLRSSGYRVTEHLVSPSFGDALVLLESDHLSLRVTRDRGLISVQVSGMPKGEWFGLEALARLTHSDGDVGDLAGIAAAAAYITAHHEQLVRMFQEDRRKEVERELEGLERASLRERFGYPG